MRSLIANALSKACVAEKAFGVDFGNAASSNKNLTQQISRRFFLFRGTFGTSLRRVSSKERPSQQQTDSCNNRDIRDVEIRPNVMSKLKLQKIDDMAC